MDEDKLFRDEDKLFRDMVEHCGVKFYENNLTKTTTKLFECIRKDISLLYKAEAFLKQARENNKQ
jgi:hypothetical protein